MKPCHEARVLSGDMTRIVEDDPLIGRRHLAFNSELSDEGADLAIARRLLPAADGRLLILHSHLAHIVDVAANEEQDYKQ